MSPAFMSRPDDWLALGWCLGTMGLCVLLIHLATVIRQRRTAQRNLFPDCCRPFRVRHDFPHGRSMHRTPAALVSSRQLSHGQIPTYLLRVRGRTRFDG